MDPSKHYLLEACITGGSPRCTCKVREWVYLSPGHVTLEACHRHTLIRHRGPFKELVPRVAIPHVVSSSFTSLSRATLVQRLH